MEGTPTRRSPGADVPTGISMLNLIALGEELIEAIKNRLPKTTNLSDWWGHQPRRKIPAKGREV